MRNDTLTFYPHKVSEVHVDLDRAELLKVAKDQGVDFIIIRVQTFSPNGRPASRTLRLPKSLLEEPAEDYSLRHLEPAL